MGTKSAPKEQVTVRINAAMVAYIDQLVADGRYSSRADYLDQAAERQRRHELAMGDIAILARDHEKDDLAELALHSRNTFSWPE